jgi:hypothetical protein
MVVGTDRQAERQGETRWPTRSLARCFYDAACGERATTRAQRFCFALVICRPLGPWSVSPSNRS